jgi:hypothetical protein
MDVDTIEPGIDFVEAIQQAVGGCDVLIAVIGNRWLTSAHPKGKRRLEIAEDSVRIEVATALKRGIRVIPVLSASNVDNSRRGRQAGSRIRKPSEEFSRLPQGFCHEKQSSKGTVYIKISITGATRHPIMIFRKRRQSRKS